MRQSRRSVLECRSEASASLHTELLERSFRVGLIGLQASGVEDPRSGPTISDQPIYPSRLRAQRPPNGGAHTRRS